MQYWFMELAKTGRVFLSLPPTRRRPLALLVLVFVGFVFAVLTFKPGMMGLPLPISSLPPLSSSFGNRISTLFYPRSSDVYPSSQHGTAQLPASTQPCMPQSEESARPPLYSRDLGASDTDGSSQQHCSGMDQARIGVSSFRIAIDADRPSVDNEDTVMDEIMDNKSSSTNVRRSESSSTDMATPSSNDNKIGKCDMHIGKWIEDDTYPLYKPESCPYVDKKYNCQQNGRPDTKYLRWRWAPRDCNMPRFSSRGMLKKLRGKRLAFVGDSLNRNQWESMLCMLRESLADKNRVVRQRGSNRILKFLDYNCTVEFYKSRYLVDMIEGSDETNYIVKLDTMDKSETKWRKADVLVFNTGHWWGPGKLGKGEHRFQEADMVYERLDVMVAYKKALSRWGQWVDTHIDPHQTRVFFRTYSPQHFRGGQWNSGGHCEDETEPADVELHVGTYWKEMQALHEVVGAMKVHVDVLNVTKLSAYRKDAHPSVYWHPQNLVVQRQDCGHWCLPGLPDVWNELLYFALTDDNMRNS